MLARKRQEYAEAVRSAFHRGESAMDAQLWHQIRIDVPRTNPGVPLWQFPSTQKVSGDGAVRAELTGIFAEP